MEVFETTSNNTQVLVASNWTEDTTISVFGLLPESNYIISVKAVNERGESSPVYVGGKTEGFIQSLPRAVEESRMPLLFVIVGVLVSLMIIGAFFTAFLTIRRRRRNKQKMEETTFRRNLEDEEDDDDGGFKQVRKNYEEDIQAETSVPLLEQRGAISASVVSVNGHQSNGQQPQSNGDQNGHNNGDRKVSFTCPRCTKCGGRQTLRPKSSLLVRERSESNNGTLNNGLPVERAIIRTFSIDKMRPICPICNPSGNTPYPTDNPLDEIVQQSALLKRNS